MSVIKLEKQEDMEKAINALKSVGIECSEVNTLRAFYDEEVLYRVDEMKVLDDDDQVVFEALPKESKERLYEEISTRLFDDEFILNYDNIDDICRESFKVLSEEKEI